MPQPGVLDGGGGGGGCGTLPPTLPVLVPPLGPGPACWMRLQLLMTMWAPPGPAEEASAGAGTNEQLLDWDEAEEEEEEDEEGVAELEDEEADDEGTTGADIPPPLLALPVPLLPPPMVES